MRVLISPGESGRVLATIAVGGDFLRLWEVNAKNSWEEYCHRHALGLVLFDEELVPRGTESWKKVHWQKMLMGDWFLRYEPSITDVCYLDTDILINPHSPNIFQSYDPECIGLTSLRKKLPYPYDLVLRRLAFLRHTHYDEKYPLDSALFMSLEQLYSYHQLPVQSDEACTGLIMFNVKKYAHQMRNWFYKYDSAISSITNGGEQTHLNYEIQSQGRVSWLDYRFQAIWPFEMAWKYPFLYELKNRNDVPLVRSCIEACLYQNYFVHFAGSWHESEMWKVGGFFGEESSLEARERYQSYLGVSVSGNSVGMIRPNSK